MSAHYRFSHYRVVLMFFAALLGNLLVVLPGQAESLLKPYILASQTTGTDVTASVADVRKKLADAGFELVGEYSPYPNANITIITNDELKQNAAATEYGGFGASLRVTVTQKDAEVQVAYTNPVYMANAYRMKSDLTSVAAALKTALGDKGEYGPEKGLSAEDLREYHYKWLMPYFTDRIELVKYKDYDAAIAAVTKSLSSGNRGGVKQVYRIDIPGKQQSVIGVSMAGPDNVECSGDKYIMDRIDFKPLRSTGHLPYEMLVSGNAVYTLPAEFRIAISFPDLSMVGSNSFASIMCAPTAISKALNFGAGGKGEEDSM